MKKKKDYVIVPVTLKNEVAEKVTKKAKELYGDRKRSFHVNGVLEKHGC
jgi:hypothetical protein